MCSAPLLRDSYGIRREFQFRRVKRDAETENDQRDRHLPHVEPAGGDHAANHPHPALALDTTLGTRGQFDCDQIPDRVATLVCTSANCRLAIMIVDLSS